MHTLDASFQLLKIQPQPNRNVRLTTSSLWCVAIHFGVCKYRRGRRSQRRKCLCIQSHRFSEQMTSLERVSHRRRSLCTASITTTATRCHYRISLRHTAFAHIELVFRLMVTHTWHRQTEFANTHLRKVTSNTVALLDLCYAYDLWHSHMYEWPNFVAFVASVYVFFPTSVGCFLYECLLTTHRYRFVPLTTVSAGRIDFPAARRHLPCRANCTHSVCVSAIIQKHVRTHAAAAQRFVCVL